MKKLFCLILLVACYTCTGYAQHYAWAKKGGNPSEYDYSNNIATDAAGNSYTVGTFYGTSTFGSFTLTSAGTSSASDIYVLKQNAAGVVQWAKRAGSPGDDWGSDITIDSNGDLIIAGLFRGTADFDATTITWLSGSTSYNMFIAKYSSSTGNLVWAKRIGGIYGDVTGKIKADQWGNFYLSGSFTGVSYFGTDSVTSTLNGNDGFVCKFDSNGDATWVRSIKGNTSDDVAWTTAVDLSGNVFVSGDFRSDTLFAGNSYVVNTDVTMSSYDCFITKYNSAGVFQWIKTINGNGYKFAPASDVDSSGNFYLTGSIIDATNFDTLTIYDSGNGDSFLAKYDPAGNCLWVRQSTGLGEEVPSSVHVSSNGRISITGSFYDYGTWGNYSFTSDIDGNSDIFIAQYDQDGNIRWAMNATGPQGNYGIGLSSDALNNLYLTGYYGGNMIMGSITLSGSSSYFDTFVAKIDILNAGIISSPNCAGSAVIVPYLGTITFNAGNVFTAQLSDASGSFASPVNIGTLTSVANSGTINAVIPISSAASSSYRIRVTSSNPAVVGSWANDFTIEAGAETPSICMVTVDDESINNIILWDKTLYTNVDSFIVYREVSTANYKSIGSVSVDSMSQFIDTARSIGPANGDPNVGSYRYKLQIRDLCGNYGALSPYHNTIYIIDAGLGQFTWNVPYAIEGGANPVNNYVLLCDTANVDFWLPVGTVAGTQTSATDPGFSNHSTIANWRVTTLWSIACDPTRTAVNTSRSNIKHASSITTGISAALLNSIEIYPNPASDFVTIELPALTQNATVTVMNSIGQLIYEENVVSSGNANKAQQINTSSFAKGVYTISIESKGAKVFKKLVIN